MSERIPNYPELVPRLSNYRKAMRITRKTVAEKTGIPVTLITKFENGTLCPYEEYAEKMASFYNITIADLIGPYHSELWALVNDGAMDMHNIFGNRALKRYLDTMRHFVAENS